MALMAARRTQKTAPAPASTRKKYAKEEEAPGASAANLLEFLRVLLVDSEGGDKHEDDPAPEGFITWRPLRMDPKDYHICEWDNDKPHPMDLDAGSHGAAYAVAMEALLRLRHWWTDCVDSGAYSHYDHTPQALKMFEDDLGAVINFLSNFRSALETMRTVDLEGRLKQAREREEAQRESLEVSKAARLAAEAAVGLAQVLDMAPVELLARQKGASEEEE